MDVIDIDWTSSTNKSSVISSMIASMESVWLTTAVPVWESKFRRPTLAMVPS